MKARLILLFALLIAAVGFSFCRFDGFLSRFIHPTYRRYSPEQQDACIRSTRELRWQQIEGPARADAQERTLNAFLAQHPNVLIELQMKGCVPCKQASQFIHSLAPRYPAVVLLEAGIDTEEWVSIVHVLRRKGWIPENVAYPYFVAVKHSVARGFYVGFNIGRGTTERLTPAASAPEGDPVSLEGVLARLVTENPGPDASLLRSPGRT